MAVSASQLSEFFKSVFPSDPAQMNVQPVLVPTGRMRFAGDEIVGQGESGPEYRPRFEEETTLAGYYSPALGRQLTADETQHLIPLKEYVDGHGAVTSALLFPGTKAIAAFNEMGITGSQLSGQPTPGGFTIYPLAGTVATDQGDRTNIAIRYGESGAPEASAYQSSTLFGSAKVDKIVDVLAKAANSALLSYVGGQAFGIGIGNLFPSAPVGSIVNQAASAGLTTLAKPGSNLNDAIISTVSAALTPVVSDQVKSALPNAPDAVTKAITSSVVTGALGGDAGEAAIKSLIGSGFSAVGDAIKTPSVSGTYPEEFQRGTAKGIVSAGLPSDFALSSDTQFTTAPFGMSDIEALIREGETGALSQGMSDIEQLIREEAVSPPTINAPFMGPFTGPRAPISEVIAPGGEAATGPVPTEFTVYESPFGNQLLEDIISAPPYVDSVITSPSVPSTPADLGRPTIPEVVAPGGEATTQPLPIDLEDEGLLAREELSAYSDLLPTQVAPTLGEVLAGEDTIAAEDEGLLPQEELPAKPTLPPMRVAPTLEELLAREAALADEDTLGAEDTLGTDEVTDLIDEIVGEDLSTDEMLDLLGDVTTEGGEAEDIYEGLGGGEDTGLGGEAQDIYEGLGGGEDTGLGGEAEDIYEGLGGGEDTGLGGEAQDIYEGLDTGAGEGGQDLIDYEEEAGKELAEAQERTGGSEEALYEEEAGKELADAEYRTGAGEDVLYEEEAGKELADAEYRTGAGEEALYEEEAGKDLAEAEQTFGATPAPAPAPTPAPAPAPTPAPAPAPPGTDLFSLLSMLGLLGGMGQRPAAAPPPYEYADIGEITPFEELFTPYSTEAYTPRQTQKRG
jgi:hypothetical protein